MKANQEDPAVSRRARFLEELSQETPGKRFRTPERLATRAPGTREGAEVITNFEELFEQLFSGED